ncbi:hypothetical protein HBI78_013530 [Parastagonospora nodorum]|nr:hypothetical protein HBI78_013530 [Parastagonospora nodorum]
MSWIWGGSTGASGSRWEFLWEWVMVGGESWVLRCITAVFASFVGLPFFMDLLLAVVMHDWKGLPTGESRYVMMFFVAYVDACFLPLFSL